MLEALVRVPDDGFRSDSERTGRPSGRGGIAIFTGAVLSPATIGLKLATTRGIDEKMPGNSRAKAGALKKARGAEH